MILDTLENLQRYEKVHPGFIKAFQFIQNTDLKNLEDGRHEIDGDRIFAIVAMEQGRRKDAAQLEVHNRYIDIQLVLQGVDEMGWRCRKSCNSPVDDFDANEDIQFFTDPPSAWIAVLPNHFTMFFPEDAHLPLISEDVIHKIVIKIEHSPSS